MSDAREIHGPVTRSKLLQAAGEIFAEKGLHGAVIRDITQRAGANIASVNYYFRDKFELYVLVLREAHATIVTAGQIPLVDGPPAERLGQLLRAFLTAALDPARPAWHTALLGRELLEPTPALDLMHDILREPTRRLLAVIRELRPDLSEKESILATCGVVAQCLFYVHHRHIARRLFPEMPEPPIDTVVEHVVAFSLAALQGLGRETGCDATRDAAAPQPERPSDPVGRRTRRRA